jgi:hypothetical protein
MSMPSSEIATDSLAIPLFSPMQVRVNGLPLPPFRPRKPLWLLAMLTLWHGRPVEREWLAGTLWPRWTRAMPSQRGKSPFMLLAVPQNTISYSLAQMP